MNYIKLSLVLTLLGMPLMAQTSHNHKRCHTDEIMEIKKNENPVEYLEKENNWKNEVADYLEKKKLHKSAMVNNDTVTLVFHVVYKTSTQNIHDSLIHNQIDILNTDYAGDNADSVGVPNVFKPFRGAPNIYFRLANRDPQGNPTTGINRYETTKSSFTVNTDAVKFASQGGADSWDTENYVNVWICRLSGGILGYALLPTSHGDNDDGVVLNYQFVGKNNTSQYNRGRTAVHEFGHYFGLQHVWGSFGGCTDDDGFNDTPIQAESNFGKPTTIPESCGTQDMYVNYMDYCDDEVLLMFTEDQSDYMRAVLSTTRKSLLTSTGYWGINVEENNELVTSIYPNPVKDFVNIQFKSSGQKNIKLYNSLGKVVLVKDTKEKNIQISTSDLSKGVYWMTISDEKLVDKRKLVIQ
jgi:hypothetical protein